MPYDERDGPFGTSDDDNLAQRQAALHAQAQAQQQPPEAGIAKRPPAAPAFDALIPHAAPRLRRLNRRIVSALSVLAVVAVIGVVVVNILGAARPGAPTARPVLRLIPQGDGLNCVSQIAWSPDSKIIAAIGNLQSCSGSQSDSQTGVVYLYNTRTGAVTGKLNSDNVIFNASSVSKVIAANTTSTSSPVMLAYTYLVWTPNAQALLIGFNLYFSTESGQSAAGVNGLLLLGLSHASPTHVWIDKIQYLQMGTVERWDLTSGVSTLVPKPPVATAYHWNSDGTLAPAVSAGDGPIGTPDGGHAFSVWQSGSLGHPTFQPGPNSEPVTSAQDIGWAANLLPVSPDGHYFYSYFPSSFSLAPPSTKTIVPGEAAQAPRDKALLMQAQAMTHAANPGQTPSTLVTWRIDGQRLAAITLNGAGAGDASPSAFTVSIYDTASGALLQRLTPSFHGLQSGSAGVETLQWSPDGTRLLLADNAYGAITIWGPGALPA